MSDYSDLEGLVREFEKIGNRIAVDACNQTQLLREIRGTQELLVSNVEQIFAFLQIDNQNNAISTEFSSIHDFEEAAQQLQGKSFKKFSELNLEFLGELIAQAQNEYAFIQTIGNGQHVGTFLTIAYNNECWVITDVFVAELIRFKQENQKG